MVREQFNGAFMADLLPKLLKVLPLTLSMALLAILFGCLLGLALTFLKLCRLRVIARITDILTVIIRAVPDVVLIYLIYFGMPALILALTGQDISKWQKPVFVVIALAIALSATTSELFRSAWNALDRGQLEAAHAIGMTGMQQFFRIIVPQGLYVILPNLSGLCLGIIQATSLAYTLGVMDVMGKAKVIDMNAFGMNTFESYLVVALIYWGISLAEGMIFKLLERRFGKGMKTVAAGEQE